MYVKPQKSYGQHFLKDETVLQAIQDAVLKYNTNLPLIEIGPGMGALTRYLIKTNLPLSCIEVDERCVEYLTQTFLSKENQFELIHADFLKVNLPKILDKEVMVVGNFPYNISSQIIFKLLDVYSKVPVVIGMFQKEVAERLAAKHGNKTYGIISILTQLIYDTEILFDIPPESFSPPPQVMSSVILLKRRDTIDQSFNYSLFKSIVKTSFNQRRKMMRSSLKQIVPKELLKDSFFDLRPEQLSVDDFIVLTKRIEQYGN